MSEVSQASSSHVTRRSLVIADSAESAFRYASSDSDEVELSVASADGAVEAVDGPFDDVVVVGFASSPATLRVVVDRAFALVGDAGRVLVGAGDGAVETDIARWDAAFDGLHIGAVDQASFPSVEVVRGEGGAAGTFLAGAISMLGAMSPRPVLTVTPLPPADAAPPTRKAAAEPASIKQRLVRAARRHRKILVLAALVALVLLAISVGLVAIFGRYYLGVLLTLAILMIAALGVRQEQRLRQLGRLESIQAEVKTLRSGLRPEALYWEVRQQSRDVEKIHKLLGVNQLAIVEAAKMLESMRAADPE